MKSVLKCGGYIYITTRSYGFPYHAYPYDFWRYEIEDMRKIFRDFEIIKLVKDHEAPGVFLKAKKISNILIDLSNIALYSMILGRRTTLIPKLSDMPLQRRLTLKLSSLNAKLIGILNMLILRNLK
jgi:hypothetical protein